VAPLRFIREEFGTDAVSKMERRIISGLMSDYVQGGRPGAARLLLTAFRNVFGFARDELRIIDADPSAGIKKPQLTNAGGYFPWTEADIAAYRNQHDLGTVARLAFEILVNTGLRGRSDVTRLGHEHLCSGNKLRIVPRKTEKLGEPVII